MLLKREWFEIYEIKDGIFNKTFAAMNQILTRSFHHSHDQMYVDAEQMTRSLEYMKRSNNW